MIAERVSHSAPATGAVERDPVLGPEPAAARRATLRSAPAVWTLTILTLAVVVATAHAYLSNALSYVDNGDGYYLYAAHRLAQGAMLYRDVMGTQPPLVYLLGAAIFKLGGTLAAVRLASAAMRALAVALVFVVGRRLFGNTVTAALAALTYALLPIGLVWDRSFDVNPPLTLLALLALWPLLHFTPRAVRVAGACAALALFTKNLYAPLLATTLVYLALRRRNLLIPYLQGLIPACTALALALAVYAGPAALRDAFLGQQSSSINTDWFTAALAYVIAAEGSVVLVAVIGALMCRRRSTRDGLHRTAPLDYAPWLLAGASAVLLATLKEGTAGPVFQLAEPAVALLAACGATHPLLRPWPHRTAAAMALLGLPVVLVLSLLSLSNADRATLAWSNSGQVARMVALIHAHARPGATIVAPPYYALLTDTLLPGDAADTYILAQRIRRGDPWAVRWSRRVVADLAARRIPIVLIDLRSAAIAPLAAALRADYRPIYGDALPPALHALAWLPLPQTGSRR